MLARWSSYLMIEVDGDEMKGLPDAIAAVNQVQHGPCVDPVPRVATQEERAQTARFFSAMDSKVAIIRGLLRTDRLSDGTSGERSRGVATGRSSPMDDAVDLTVRSCSQGRTVDLLALENECVELGQATSQPTIDVANQQRCH
jgi:hypothetical protein